MWNLKYGENELIYKTETGSQTQITNIVTKGEKCGGRDKLGIWGQQRLLW